MTANQHGAMSWLQSDCSFIHNNNDNDNGEDKQESKDNKEKQDDEDKEDNQDKQDCQENKKANNSKNDNNNENNNKNSELPERLPGLALEQTYKAVASHSMGDQGPATEIISQFI